jgi:hypothetical protein
MKHLMKPLILGATLMLAAALPAQAACYADYRAQQTNPVRFHYGVAQVSDSACGNPSAAAAELQSRLQRGGWILVDVLSTFSDDGLASRRQNAGEFYLAF